MTPDNAPGHATFVIDLDIESYFAPSVANLFEFCLVVQDGPFVERAVVFIVYVQGTLLSLWQAFIERAGRR
jgi:hypothetical protein